MLKRKDQVIDATNWIALPDQTKFVNSSDSKLPTEETTMSREQMIARYTDPKCSNLKLRLAKVPARPIAPQNAADSLRQLLHDAEEFRHLKVHQLEALNQIADLLDSYRFLTGKLLANNPDEMRSIETFAPEHLAAVQGDIDG
jgi:hypothetical protein